MNTKTQKPTAETKPTPEQAPDQVKTAQATEPTTEQAPATHRITAVPATGFCRAGRRWYREATDVNEADFTADEWAALCDEPMLVVVRL